MKAEAASFSSRDVYEISTYSIRCVLYLTMIIPFHEPSDIV
jgi:hypothetical protein